MKLDEWIQANWKALLLCVALLLLLDIDIQLHRLNTRSRRIASAVADLNDRVANVEDSTAIMQEDLDEITGHTQNDNSDEDGSTKQ